MIYQSSLLNFEIYEQAYKSEMLGLDQLCGIGYRKSIEFLIKDFIIIQNLEAKDDVAKKQLSPCIKEFIQSKHIKSLAIACAWIGNDETHYTRKHEDYSLGHLKAFVGALVTYIDSELKFAEANKLLCKFKK